MVNFKWISKSAQWNLRNSFSHTDARWFFITLGCARIAYWPPFYWTVLKDEPSFLVPTVDLSFVKTLTGPCLRYVDGDGMDLRQVMFTFPSSAVFNCDRVLGRCSCGVSSPRASSCTPSHISPNPVFSVTCQSPAILVSLAPSVHVELFSITAAFIP